MPVCQGLPDGPCPSSKNDSSVKWSICDLFLCAECYNRRCNVVSDNMDGSSCNGLAPQRVDIIVGAVGNSVRCVEKVDKVVELPMRAPIQCELLCFIADKCQILPFDQLVKICVDFYKEGEIMSARQLLEDAGLHLTKRKGSDKSKSTVENMVKRVLNPNNILPLFFAATLSKLPPVDITHCDVSSILKELQVLRAEVREFGQLQVEIHSLRQSIVELETLKAGHADL